MAKERIFWGIHAGKTGDAEALFEKQEVVALGWPDMGNLNELKTRDDFKRRYEQIYTNAKPGAVPVNAGQLYRFVHELKSGDIAVFPLKRTREIWLGEVKGEYQYAPALDPHYPDVRKVEWLKKFPRTRFSQGALYEIGSAMSFFQIKNFAHEFAAALERKDFEPVSIQEEEDAISQVADDIEQQSHDFVLKQISQKLKGHGLAEFVGHLLTLMGYKAKVSPPGPDRGIDIVAHKDDLGVVPPTVLVQVKSGDGEINEAAVSELYGKVSHLDFGIVIAIGGFNRRARDFAFSKRNLNLIDGDELVDLVYKYYDQLDGKYKGMIPLRHVFIPESLTEE
jgi:restriction system protein